MISTVAPCSLASGSLWRICFCKEPRTEYPQSASLISVPAARSSLLTRMAVILHERLGTWSAQLRPRLQGRPVHWIETRSATDLDKALLGLACPVVLIDLKRNVVKGLSDLDRLMRLFPGTRVLVLDPEAHDGVAELARELGATHVISGFVPPPEVACLIDRWITLADLQTDRAGWSRPMTTDTPTGPRGMAPDRCRRSRPNRTSATSG